jgi:CRISPR-associated protein Csb2
MKGGVGELQVAVAGTGTLSDLRAIGAGLANAIEELLGPPGGTTAWVSATPFVPPRHLKKQGRSSLAGQVEAELKVRGFPPPKVEVLEWTSETLALRHFVRLRQRGPQPPIDIGFAIQLSFDSPVVGPICLGYGCHFGLGRFLAK